ncbi:hypothetical protein Egran_02190 [Elaphomyces granulatus]|uniref:Fungal N-terminal domain-containing protein n=1 Tax=Elaphomyces granulatus TaxID=519963 RepID=A0A232M1S6_9EURO|nr:hypothetical protein Egran_02190 [Elaphomyces granulatus]
MFDILMFAGLPALVVQFFICLDSFRTAPREAQELHDNISNLRLVLGQLDKSLGADQNPSACQLRSAVKACQSVFGPLLDKAMGVANGNNPWRRFVWIFRREKYQRTVNDISLKLQTLQLSLATEDRKRQRDTENLLVETLLRQRDTESLLAETLSRQRDTESLLAETLSKVSVLLEEVLNKQIAEETWQELVILSPDSITPKSSTLLRLISHTLTLP